MWEVQKSFLLFSRVSDRRLEASQASWRPGGFFTDDPCSMAVISSGSFDKGRCVENLLFLLGSASAIFLLLPQFLRNICRKPDEEAAEATLQAWRVSQSVKPEPKPKARLL